MKEKMIPAFQKAQGGLFSSVEKADVGDAYQKLEAQGVALMGWADPFMPDYSLPQHIESALMKAIKEESAAHYTAPIGNAELKSIIAEKLAKQNQLNVDSNRNILITPGSDSGLYFAILPFVHPGDEVIVFSPSYPNNFLDVEIMGGKVIPVSLKKEEGYQINATVLEESYTEKTKVVVLTHPNNPTTTVFNQDSLNALRDFVVKHDLILVCDQAFEDYTYENHFITPASLDGMFERTVTVFSFSKGMGLSGLRVGYIVCSDEIMDSLYANAVAVIGATSTAAQKAMIKAFDDLSFMKEFERSFDYRRHQAFEILNSIPGVSCLLPESGFLCWADVSQLDDSSEIVDYLLKEAKVSVNDGKNYGLDGAGYIRIVLGVYKDNEKVVHALKRIKEALLRYPKNQ